MKQRSKDNFKSTSTAVLCAMSMGVALPVSQASALTEIYGFNDAGSQYIGSVNHDGSVKQWLCDDGPSPGDAQWTQLGTSSLNDDYTIHGDAASGTGSADTMRVIRGTTTVTGDCAPLSGSWGALSYSTYYLDVVGDAGNDIIYGGAGDTWAFGGPDNDWITQYSGIGSARGEDGDDDIFGQAGSGDELFGGAGDDCLQDGNNTWTGYDCGSGTDSWYFSNTASGKVSCENREDACCGFC